MKATAKRARMKNKSEAYNDRGHSVRRIIQEWLYLWTRKTLSRLCTFFFGLWCCFRVLTQRTRAVLYSQRELKVGLAVVCLTALHAARGSALGYATDRSETNGNEPAVPATSRTSTSGAIRMTRPSQSAHYRRRKQDQMKKKRYTPKWKKRVRPGTTEFQCTRQPF